MDNFGLHSKHVNILTQVFNEFINLNSIYIYGSRALGTFKERSDVDLVLMDKDIDRQTLGKLIFEINNSDFPYTVDVQNFSSIKNPALIQHIQKFGKPFFERV